MTNTDQPLSREFQHAASDLGTGARAAAKGTDAYVRENPWPMMGACAALGIAVGYALARRAPSNGHGA